MSTKRDRLAETLVEAIFAAPEKQRADLREALADYNSTYHRGKQRRPPLLRTLMEAIEEGTEEPLLGP